MEEAKRFANWREIKTLGMLKSIELHKVFLTTKIFLSYIALQNVWHHFGHITSNEFDKDNFALFQFTCRWFQLPDHRMEAIVQHDDQNLRDRYGSSDLGLDYGQ